MVKRKNQSKKKLIIVAAIILLSAGLIFYFVTRKSETKTTQTGPQETINLAPATKEERKQAEDNKQEITKQEEAIQNSQTPQASNGKKIVTPQLNVDQYGNTVEAGGVISNIFEEGGTCTVIFTKGASSISKNSIGTREGSSTYCPAISVPSSEFASKGTWSVVLSYRSNSSEGSSAANQVEVR